MLQWCPPGYVYILMCFLTRTLEATASAASSVANTAIATYTFPFHISTVLVRAITDVCIVSIYTLLSSVNVGVSIKQLVLCVYVLF